MPKSLTTTELKTLAIIVLVAICGTLGIDIHLPSLPSIMNYMNTDKQHMQQSISFFLLGMGLSLLVYGPLSDKYGRKPVVIFGLLLASVSSLAIAFTHRIDIFLLIRLLQGIGSGVCTGVGRTIIADILQGERFVIIGSYFSMVVSLSPLIAPTIGGYIQHGYGWQANFIILSLFLFIIVLLYAVFCPETNHHKNRYAFSPRGLYHNYKSLVLHPLFIGCTLITGIGMAANMAYATTSAFILQLQFHLSPIAYGWITAIAGAGGVFGKFISPFFVRRYGTFLVMKQGFGLMAAAGLWLMIFLILHKIDVPLLMIAVFTVSISLSFIMPSAASHALSPFIHRRGSAGALYGSFQMLTAFVSSAIIGSLASNGIILLTATYIILSILGLAIYYWIPQKQHH